MVGTQAARAPFGLYIHVPFCSTRCGYCDFNTYTPGELGNPNSQAAYLDALEVELELAAARLARTYGAAPQAQTVFVGGGTPSLLGADGLGRVLNAARNTFGLAPDAEITTESNPESTSPEFFAGLLDAGFNRVSLGMQSASAGVLRILERAHTPGRAFDAAREARAAGFEHVNLDMIYGTPTEQDSDVLETVRRAVDTGIDHLSAYSLIIEDGTRMARKVRSGEFQETEDDVLARRYELIAAELEAAGMGWYEVSNWARPGGECQHNTIYWVDGNWWGAGPGAHSHLDGERFYNVKHPARYSAALLDAAPSLPIADTEALSSSERHTEALMLGLRLRDGVPLAWLDPAARPVVDGFVSRGLVEVGELDAAAVASSTALVPGRDVPGPRVRVTDAGRLLADGIITDILVAEERE